ncbi:MAG TPA: hypothetical protein VKR62_17285, partial [Roseiarcus sp.]|nr:hypothetical protein [Roseiarcus sp.]
AAAISARGWSKLIGCLQQKTHGESGKRIGSLSTRDFGVRKRRGLFRSFPLGSILTRFGDTARRMR